MKPTTHKNKRRPALMIATALFCVSYLILCCVMYSRASEPSQMEERPASMELAENATNYKALRYSAYYRALAEKLPYYPHNPEMVSRLFSIAIVKAPADFEILVSYASYLADRNCCPEKVKTLLNESIRRAPTNPRMYRAAAAYLISSKSSKQALPLIRKAIELQPSSAPDLYRLLEQSGASVSNLVAATPDSADALIQLVHHLAVTSAGNNMAAESLFKSLDRYRLSAHQKVIVSQLALKTGQPKLAEKQALSIVNDPENTLEALTILVEVSWIKKDMNRWQQYLKKLEQEYLKAGRKDDAANTLLSAAQKLWHSGNHVQGRQMMFQLIEDYPAYPPAYFFLATTARNQSNQQELNYLWKAAELDPKNGEYHLLLGSRLLENQKFQEAEVVFKTLSQIAGYEVDGFMGLAQCKREEGDLLDAIRILEEAKAYGHTDALFVELGKLYNAWGDSQKAEEHFQRALQINPNNKEAAAELQ